MTDTLPDLELVYNNELIRLADLDATDAHNAALLAVYRAGQEASRWQPIETAPKGGGADLVTDPQWVRPPKILLRFGDEAVSVAYWDWYYAEGGNGYRNGFAWIEPCSGESLDLHYTTAPTHWQPLPDPPQPEGAG